MHDRLIRAVDLHTILGMFGGIGAWLLQHSDQVSLTLGWLSLLIGLAVAAMSLAIKIHQYRAIRRAARAGEPINPDF